MVHYIASVPRTYIGILVASLAALVLLAECSAADRPLIRVQSPDARRNTTIAYPLRGGALGVDVSSLVSRSQFECLHRDHGISFVVVRCYQSLGHPDSDCPETVANAWAAGMSHVDLYHFPDTHQDPTTQVREAAEYIRNHKIRFGDYWLDIEPYSGGWAGGHAGNAAFIAALVKAVRSEKLGDHVGLYTNWVNWDAITGDSDILRGSGVRIWYPHWDDRTEFSDFKSFGGWSSPAMKQYRGGHSECGVDVDANWYA